MVYAAAVAFYTLLAIWRLRRSAIHEARLKERNLLIEAKVTKNGEFVNAGLRDAAQFEGK